MIREFSAGGVVVRRMRGRPFVAVVRVRDSARPAQGPSGAGASPSAEAAQREVREEAGLEAELVEKLDDIRYWYARDGERVMKIVSFFLFRYRAGSVEHHDHEVEEALWIPLEEAPTGSPTGARRRWPTIALSRIAEGR